LLPYSRLIDLQVCRYLKIMYNWKCLLILSVCSSVSVFVIINGQFTTDEDGDSVDQLIFIIQEKVVKLETENNVMSAMIAVQRATLAELESGQSDGRSGRGSSMCSHCVL